jgi:hypothetical protein
MALARKLFVNWHRKRRQRSDTSASDDSVQRIAFLKYEQVPFEVVVVEPDPAGGPNSFARVDITSLSLKMAINDTQDDASPLVEQATWAKNTSTNTFSATLDLNTAGMNSYITGDKAPYFEIELFDGTNRVKILSELCTVALSVMPVTTVSPDPTRVYPTLAELMGIFVPRVMGIGETITIPSPSGEYRVILGCNDDATFKADVEDNT